MSGSSRDAPVLVLSDADRRWARAAALVRQPPPRRRWEGVLGAAALVVAVGVVVSGSLVVLLSHGSTTPAWLRLARAAPFGLVSVAVIGASVAFFRRAGLWSSPLTSLGRSQRREVVRRIRGQQGADDEHPERSAVAVDVAHRQADPWGPLLLGWGIAVGPTGLALAEPGSRYLLGLLAFSWVVAGTSTFAALRDRRAARRFLGGLPAPR